LQPHGHRQAQQAECSADVQSKKIEIRDVIDCIPWLESLNRVGGGEEQAWAGRILCGHRR